MSLRSPRHLLATVGSAAALLAIAGCGGDKRTVPVPSRVPAGAVAIVDDTPIAIRSFRRWLPIVSREGGGGAGARRRAVSYLVEAQWAFQEAEAEGIDDSVVRRLVADRLTGAPGRSEARLSRDERAFRARLAIVVKALRQRHRKLVGQPDVAEVSRYYAHHPHEFTVPAVRHTLMVVTPTRAAALAARSALRDGQHWSKVAGRFSVDSSKATGGAYAVVAGARPKRLVHAAFAVRRDRLVGPLRAIAPDGHTAYYLFKVVGASPARRRPLRKVRLQVRGALEQAERAHAFAVYARDFERRWRARTLCAGGYLVPQCRNSRPSRRSRR